MKRILVIGCPGSGKSTFARALQAKTDLPLFYLDRIYWNADRTTVAREVFDARLEEILRGDEWIIDGNYSRTMERRIRACDTVFFLDYPTEVCLDGIASRRGKPREDMPWIEDTVDEEFASYVKEFSASAKPQILALLDQYAKKQIVVFHSRAEADEWIVAYKKNALT